MPSPELKPKGKKEVSATKWRKNKVERNKNTFPKEFQMKV